jgi:tetratricopeptide (TPR) repeat protein
MTESTVAAEQASPEIDEAMTAEQLATAFAHAALSGAMRNLHKGNPAMVRALLARALEILPEAVASDTQSSSEPPTEVEVQSVFANSISRYAIHVINHGQYELAGALAVRAIKIVAECGTPPLLQISDTLCNAGVVLWGLERADQSIDPLQQALNILDLLRPEASEDQPTEEDEKMVEMTMIALQNLITSYMTLNRFDDAKPLVERLRALLPPDTIAPAVYHFDAHMEAVAATMRETAASTDFATIPTGPIPKSMLN